MSGVSTGLIVGVYAVLLLFGVGYNLLIAWLERRHYLHGHTALAVVGGVLITLAGVALVSWQAALLALGAFCASGIPMVLGSIWRSMKESDELLADLRKDIR